MRQVFCSAARATRVQIEIGIIVEGLADQSDFDSDTAFDKHVSSV